MKDFELHYPASLSEALELLPKERGPQSPVPMSGGQDLLPELKEHLLAPSAVVNLKRIDELGGASFANGGARLGALLRIAEIEAREEIRASWPVLAEAAGSIASAQVRNQATLGGNLCQRPRCWYYRNEDAVCLKKGGTECFSYDGRNKYNAILGGGPSYIVHPSDMAPALVALEAEIELVGPAGARRLPLEHFFYLPADGDPLRENVLAPDELVRAVHLPAGRDQASGWRSTYQKFKERESFDWALASVALALRFEAGKIAEARICLGGVAPVPWRVPQAEALARGQAPDPDLAARISDKLLQGAEPLAENAYKLPLVRALVARALAHLAQGAR